MTPKHFSPRTFLQARHPEQFSDSVVEEGRVLDRSMLEYYLGTLTNRSQETDFEDFARHLAGREICPNLLPHTGPTGGGDSKVDAETYPVADSLSLTWYSGIGREAGEGVGVNLGYLKELGSTLVICFSEGVGVNLGYLFFGRTEAPTGIAPMAPAASWFRRKFLRSSFPSASPSARAHNEVCPLAAF
jgi:hypothetical protein